MSLKDDLVKVYMANAYDTLEFQAEFNKLTQTMMKMAGNGKCQYEVIKDEFPVIMDDVATTRLWLDNNDLSYRFATNGNKFSSLTISWL